MIATVHLVWSESWAGILAQCWLQECSWICELQDRNVGGVSWMRRLFRAEHQALLHTSFVCAVSVVPKTVEELAKPEDSLATVDGVLRVAESVPAVQRRGQLKANSQFWICQNLNDVELHLFAIGDQRVWCVNITETVKNYKYSYRERCRVRILSSKQVVRVTLSKPQLSVLDLLMTFWVFTACMCS